MLYVCRILLFKLKVLLYLCFEKQSLTYSVFKSTCRLEGSYSCPSS